MTDFVEEDSVGRGRRGGGKCRCVGPDEAEQKGVGVDRERERLQRAIT